MKEGLNFSNPKDEAIANIKAIIAHVGLLGANDYEIPALNGLIQRIKDGSLDPDSGLKEAEKIKSGKQDDH